ncbi:hypothetical protein RND81_04G000400 [Saponaria officinalis]|uniref:Uncharacterized protein n=1 Tax=Saponaria officinalis TaxID=3572 RepID=A0AAW1LII5_SAPOF
MARSRKWYTNNPSSKHNKNNKSFNSSNTSNNTKNSIGTSSPSKDTNPISPGNPLQAFDLDKEMEVLDGPGEEEANDTEWMEVGRSAAKSAPEILKFSQADVEEEVKVWSTVVYGYVVGANPPWSVINGFLKRVW